MKRVAEIKTKREGKFVMDRLLKSQEHQRVHDIVEVRKGMSLIRSPAAGLKVSDVDLSVFYVKNNWLDLCVWGRGDVRAREEIYQ